MPTLLTAAISALALSTIGTFWWLAGWVGVAYLCGVAAIAVPGLPLGFALFGRQHAAGWVAGLALGYAATTLAWWAVILFGHATTPSFVAAWITAVIVAWLVTRRFPTPAIPLPAWKRASTAALALLLLLTPALVGLPFSKLGSTDDQGNRRYRAYFLADFVWHTALGGELMKHEPLPRNPFMGSEPVHYYWTYFRIPSTVAAQTGIDVQTALKLNATIVAFLLLAAMYVAAWAALPERPGLAAIAVALAFLGPSAEGLAAIVDLIRRGHPLTELRDLNIDAVASWAFKGVRVDNLPRAMWYNPQHSISCVLGLLAVPAAIWGVQVGAAGIVLNGCLLAASVAFNPLLGASFCAVYGATLLVAALTGRASLRDLVRHGLAVVPVVASLAWAVFNQVGDGAADALVFGLWGAARNATVLNMALQLGPLLIPIAVGLWPSNRLAYARLGPAISGIAIGMVLMHLVALTVNPAWVPFRGGQLFLVLAPAIVAYALARLWDTRRRWAGALIALVVVTGFPTTVIDLYNTQDVTNRGLSPGAEFHWTLVITKAQLEGLDWIRHHTPPGAIVQQEPIIRAREYWSFIPTFAQRRMATGNPIALLPVPEYALRNERVKNIYATADAKLAWQDARLLGIDYLWVDSLERAAYPGVAKFDTSPEYFSVAFKNAEASVYALRP